MTKQGYKNKLKYIKKYTKENYIGKCVLFRKDTEKDLLDWSTRNHQFSKYVKDLIRDDMNSAN